MDGMLDSPPVATVLGTPVDEGKPAEPLQTMTYRFRKCGFADELIQYGRGCIVTVEKVKLPLLDGKNQCQDWKFSLENHLRRNEMLEPVFNMMRKHDYYGVRGGGDDEITFRRTGRPDTEDNHVSWGDEQLSAFRDLGVKASQFLTGRARTLIQQNKCTNVVEIMLTMLIAFGRGSEMEREKMMEEFLTVKWNPAKECLKDFSSKKLWILDQNPDEVEPGPQVHRAMIRVLLRSMPSSYDNLVNEIRARRYTDWTDVEERLIAYEDQLGAKNEPKGRVYTAVDGEKREVSKSKKAKIDSIFKKGAEEDLAGASKKDLDAYIASRIQSATDIQRSKQVQEMSAFRGTGKGGRGDKTNTCFNCGMTGHWSYECRAPRRDGGKGKGKGGDRKGGKKGIKGKGKGGKGPQYQNKAISQAPY